MWESFKIKAIAILGKLLWKLLAITYRVEYIITDTDQCSHSNQEPKIFAFWHGHQIFMPLYYLKKNKSIFGGKPLTVLISQHRDGRIAAELIHQLGLNSVAGSSSKGGARALVSLIKCLRAGNHVAITPDGPKGPIHKVKPGIFKLLEHSEVKVYPLAIAANKFWQFNSWDKMFLPKPFSKVTIAQGEAFHLDCNESQSNFEVETKNLEKRINETCLLAERHLGQ